MNIGLEAPFVYSLLSVYFSKFTPRCLVRMHPEPEQLLNLVYCFNSITSEGNNEVYEVNSWPV